jgi:hypothetical protein
VIYVVMSTSDSQTLPPPYQLQRDMAPWRYMAAVDHALHPSNEYPAGAMRFQRFQLHSDQIAHIPIYPPGVGYMVVNDHPASMKAEISILNGSISSLVLTPLVRQSFTADCACRPLHVTIYRGPVSRDGLFAPLTKPLNNPKYRDDLFVDIVP